MTKIKRVQAKATIKRVLTLEEIQAFMRQFSYRDALIVRMALVLGLRPAELFGLKWEDCDFRKKQLRIDETYALGEWKPTKTESSNGWVTLPDELIADLEQWRQQAEGSPYIFPAARGGNPVHSKKLLHQIIRPAAIKAGIMQPRPKHLPKGAFWNNKPTAVNFQVFRRTCATLLNANSKDIKATQSHLRHTDPNTTLKFYTAE